MRLIDPVDLVERLKAAKERYQNSDEIVDRAIVVGLERAITEVILSPTEMYKSSGLFDEFK